MSDDPARKAWAVLAYTVADDKSTGDSLDAAAKEELKSICDAADFGEMSIAAQVDFKSTRGVFRGVLTAPPRTRGFEDIPAESHPLWRGIKARLERARLRVLRETVDLNAARGQVVRNFLRFGRTQCPADRYVIFFYGHGFGPLGLFYDKEPGAAQAATLQVSDLAGSLDAVSDRAAVIVFRACMANTIETAYQLRDAAEFMIASQSIVPIAGVWPWATYLAALRRDASSEEVGASIARQIGAFLEEPENRRPFADVPYSLVDLGAAEAVVEPLRALTTGLNAARDDDATKRACIRALDRARVGVRNDPSKPGDPALLDVSTMCEELGRISSAAVANPASTLGAIVNERLIKWTHSQRGAHRGIALFYKPTQPAHIEGSCIFDPELSEIDDPHYRDLALCRATGWDRVALDPLVP